MTWEPFGWEEVKNVASGPQCERKWRPKQVDPNDPDYILEANIFNAITRHPDVDLYLSNRNLVTKKTVRYMWKQVRKLERKRDRRLNKGKYQSDV